jgi:hypothetical protein
MRNSRHRSSLPSSLLGLFPPELILLSLPRPRRPLLLRLPLACGHRFLETFLLPPTLLPPSPSGPF